MKANVMANKLNSSRKLPRILTVKKAWRFIHMIRVVFGGQELDDFPEGRRYGAKQYIFQLW